MLDCKVVRFHLEYALVAFQLMQWLLQLLFYHHLTIWAYVLLILVFALLSTIKSKIEGFRTNFVLALANEAVFYATRYAHLLLHLQLFICVVLLCLIEKMVVLTLPKTNGWFQVGYKYVEDPKENLHFSVFYPTTNYQNCAEAYWMPIKHYWQKLIDNQNKDVSRPSWVPRFFVQIGSQYLNKLKLGAYENAAIIGQDQYEFTLLSKYSNQLQVINRRVDRMPVVILSHGLSMHCNANSTIAREFASKGCFVMSIHHEEEIKNQFSVGENNRFFRSWQLTQRVNRVQRHLDFIHQEGAVDKLFQKKVALNLASISIGGHSFGGSTAIAVSQLDPRINGACLCLDPCTYPLSDELTMVIKSVKPEN